MKINYKLLVALIILLVILLMEKYQVTIGNFDVDTIYQGIYYDEDIEKLQNSMFMFENE